MYFLELVRKIKNKNVGKVYIVKSGIFYYALDKDTIIKEKYCNLIDSQILIQRIYIRAMY
ncbi:MAG: hypothetical protein PHD15_04380 [Clostridia bacterium]|nr:hypothetical protein [Clostridia bacterium]MDD4386976.1 hypothetical protein [Clostridia bacterium]